MLFQSHAAEHADPLNGAAKAIAVAEDLEMCDRKLRPRVLIELENIVAGIVGHTTILNPVHDPTEVILHGVRMIGGGDYSCSTDGEQGQGEQPRR